MAAGKGIAGAAGLLLVVASFANAGPIDEHRVAVRVYDRAGLDTRTSSRALEIAREALRSSSIDVEWTTCVPGRPNAACDRPLGGASSCVSYARSKRQPASPQALGDALVDMTTGSAVFATIYVQRVHRLAQTAGTDDAEVLGYAIAHELGHLLMASHLHSEEGLMRSQWRERDLRQRRDADWRFSLQDAAAIRDRMEAARLSPNIVWTTR
jgi:hypothetical protein